MSFERGFSEVERAARSVSKASATLNVAAKALLRAARDGDIVAINKSVERLSSLADALRQEASNACSAWPFTLDSEEQFLKSGYLEELLKTAEGQGVRVQRHDNQLVAYPFIIRVLPSERAVRLNRDKLTGLRPTALSAKLKQAQAKKSRANVQPFLDALYSAYQMVAPDGGTVPLTRLYKAFTLLPNASAEYGRDDFARDILALDRSGIDETRSGIRISLPASTATKDSRDIITCVSPDGEQVTYYGSKLHEGGG